MAVAALVALKLVLLPAKTPADAAALGVSQRIAQPVPVTGHSHKETP